MLNVRTKLIFGSVVLSASVAFGAIVGVTGLGSHPVTDSTLAFWLLREDGKPLVIAYYHGPGRWHDTPWRVDSRFTQSAVGWAELKSAKATLRLRLDLNAGQVEVQRKKFSLAQNNTFLITHTTDAQQTVIPLGHHDLPKSGASPAAVLFLEADKSLRRRIEIAQ